MGEGRRTDEDNRDRPPAPPPSPPASEDAVVLLEDLAPRKDVKGGQKIILGENISDSAAE